MPCRVVSVPEAKLSDFKKDLISQFKQNDRPGVLFISRPPLSLPVCIRQIAQHGYWFAPTDVPSTVTEEPFELLVESSKDCWMYIGRYRLFPLAETYSMAMSEWAVLDEETKNHQCLRMLRKSQPGIQGVSLCNPALLALRAKLDSAEYAVPCMGLRCMGYDTKFGAAVGAALGSKTSAMEVPAARQTEDSSAL